MFGSSGALIGVVAAPEHPEAKSPAVVFLNAGVTHRVGPNRLHVHLARALAEEGFVTLRFDFSGLGDSSVRADDLPAIKSVVVETREAMDLLTETYGVESFILVGICSGATSSYLTAREDERVVGAVMINAQGHLHGDDLDLGDHLRARTLARHSWRIALKSSFRSKNWRKAIQGQLQPKRILRMMFGGSVEALRGRRKGAQAPRIPDVLSDLRELTGRGVRLFHLYCEGDEGLDYFHVVLGDKMRDVETDENSRFEVIRGSNHVFTLLWSQERLVELVCEWARSTVGAGAQ
jgi:pimeloyl-ACP methyl ester carboxylesterase